MDRPNNDTPSRRVAIFEHEINYGARPTIVVQMFLAIFLLKYNKDVPVYEDVKARTCNIITGMTYTRSSSSVLSIKGGSQHHPKNITH